MPRARVLREIEHGAGGGRVRSIRRRAVRAALRRERGTALDRTWGLLPDAVHRLLRGAGVAARDRVALRGQFVAAGVSRGRADAEDAGALEHDADPPA